MPKSVEEHCIELTEWSSANHSTHPYLKGYTLTEQGRVDALALNNSRRLEIIELREGLEVRTRSFVGSITCGPLRITIHPKLPNADLLKLVKYAYGFRRMSVHSATTLDIDRLGFQDLLIKQLCDEVEEIVKRGIHRSYEREAESLSTPRGRIDLVKLASIGGMTTASLPCIHFPRSEDTVLNQVLYSGLLFCGSIASDLNLRRGCIRLTKFFDQSVVKKRFAWDLLEFAEMRITRLTAFYGPSLAILRLLFSGRGIYLEKADNSLRLNGFLFDMNSFFQALVSRILRDGLTEFHVKDERSLNRMMAYDRKFNPQNRRSPKPRPDFAVIGDQGRTLAILDAKYRDLWHKSLPNSMLYQLVVYAVSQQHLLRSTIVYPTLAPDAFEARINVSDPISQNRLGQVRLIPLNLRAFAELLNDDSGINQRLALAHALAGL